MPTQQLVRLAHRCTDCGYFFTKLEDDPERCQCGGPFRIDASFHPQHRDAIHWIQPSVDAVAARRSAEKDDAKAKSAFKQECLRCGCHEGAHGLGSKPGEHVTGPCTWPGCSCEEFQPAPEQGTNGHHHDGAEDVGVATGG